MAESCDKVLWNGLNVLTDNKIVQQTELSEENKTDEAMDRMLLEDYNYDNLPLSLENILKYCDEEGRILSRVDYVIMFIYVLMLECGFVPPDYDIKSEGDFSVEFNYQRLLNNTAKFPHCLNSGGQYVLTFVLPSYTNYACSIICVLSNEDLIVTSVINDIPDKSNSTLVDILLHVVGTDSKPRIFQYLDKLSRQIKVEIGFPAKAAILWKNKNRYGSMLVLPTEIIEHIMGYCPEPKKRELKRLVFTA